MASSEGIKQKPVDKSVQSCSQAHKEENKECNHSGIGITIDGLYTKTSDLKNHKVVQIVAGKEKNSEKVKVDTLGLVGPCERHTDKIYDIREQEFKDKTDSKLSFDAKSHDPRGESLGLAFNKYLWPKELSPKYYYVYCNSCGEKHSARIEVYPDLEWEYAIEGKLEWDVKKGFKMQGSGKGSAAAKFDGDKIFGLELSLSDEKREKTGIQLFDAFRGLYWGLQGMCSKFDDFFKYGNGSFKLESGVKIDAKYGWEQVPGRFEVDHAVSVNLTADPLIKADASYEFLGPLLNTIPGIGSMLATIVWVYEKANAGKIDLTAGIAGSIVAGMELMHVAGEKNNRKNKTKLEGIVEFYLKFLAEFDVSIELFFGYGVKSYAKFEAGGKAEIGVKISEEDGDYIDTQGSYFVAKLEAAFLGLTVYLVTAKSMGISSTKSKSHASYFTESKSEEEIPKKRPTDSVETNRMKGDVRKDPKKYNPDIDKDGNKKERKVSYKIIDAISIVHKKYNIVG